MIGHEIHEGNEVWSCYIKFVQLVERLCALPFTFKESKILEILIPEFFQLYLQLFSDINMTPKAHFLTQYPEMIRRFGPLVKTLRFEAKQYFNSVIHLCKSRKNIFLTMTKRHQFMMYLHNSKECFLEHVKPCIFKSKEVAVEMSDFYKKEAVVNLFPLTENDLMTSGSAILFHGQKYSLGDAIITGFNNDDYTFGLVDTVLLHNGNVYLLFGLVDTVLLHNGNIYLLYDFLDVDYFGFHVKCYKLSKTEHKYLLLISNLPFIKSLLH